MNKLSKRSVDRIIDKIREKSESVETSLPDRMEPSSQILRKDVFRDMLFRLSVADMISIMDLISNWMYLDDLKRWISGCPSRKKVLDAVKACRKT